MLLMLVMLLKCRGVWLVKILCTLRAEWWLLILILLLLLVLLVLLSVDVLVVAVVGRTVSIIYGSRRRNIVARMLMSHIPPLWLWCTTRTRMMIMAMVRNDGGRSFLPTMGDRNIPGMLTRTILLYCWYSGTMMVTLIVTRGSTMSSFSHTVIDHNIGSMLTGHTLSCYWYTFLLMMVTRMIGSVGWWCRSRIKGLVRLLR
mmetsp:Transcript_25844/g.61209  ORF Transcript_25844/g.61209 Transcript_25844/m.61209 type:complete len:201 (+) Transcript_25844:459-1061(+)